MTKATPSVLDSARRELARGHQPVSIPIGLKGPKTANWGQIRYTPESLTPAFGPGKNIGLLLGAASNHLVDIDMDCPEAVAIGNQCLPPTDMIAGRPASPQSHRFYRAEKSYPGVIQFRDPRDDKMLIEYRTSDGTKAVQTVIPPSVHPDGERYAWDVSGEPSLVQADTLLSTVGYVAAAALLARCFPESGRHKFCLALAGGLLRRGWNVDPTERFLELVAETGGSDDPATRASVASYTQSRLEADEPATGFNTLAEMLGDEGAKVISCLHQWLSLDDVEATQWSEENLTELGVARRIAREHAQELFYVPERGCWFHWDGKRWVEDSDRRIWTYATDTIEGIGKEARAKLATIDDSLREILTWKGKKRDEALADFDPNVVKQALTAQKMLAFSLTMETRAKIAAVTDLAESLPVMVKRFIDLDSDPWLFNVRNGTLDLRTGILQAHRREDFITKLSDVDYDPRARAPRFEQFLEEILPDPELREYVQRAHGYSMTGLTTEQCLFLCIGTGANGKSVLDKVRRAYMGDYAKRADAGTFMTRKGEGPRNDLAALVGARLVDVSEIDKGKSFSEALVKQTTSGDVVAARFLYREMFEYTPVFKLWMSSNYRPRVYGIDDGIWRRLRVIPFEVQIPKEQRDSDLDKRLVSDELPGIITWAVNGCLMWQKVGLGEPQVMEEVLSDYRDAFDQLADWLDACCHLKKDAWVLSCVLYENYRSFSLRNGVDPLRKETFGELLPHKGLRPFRPYVNGKQERAWKGVILKS